MRLIDDNALLEAWNNLSERGRKEFDQVIMTQPTAYDVDKVVAELKEFKNLVMLNNSCCKCIIDKAIDIVKRNSN